MMNTLSSTRAIERVDDLLDEGYSDVSVLDLSGKALEVCRQRLGPRGSAVRWFEADLLAHAFEPGSVDVWHDRAVFHFLTDESTGVAMSRRCSTHLTGRVRDRRHLWSVGSDAVQRPAGRPLRTRRLAR